jgi:hypothetical protein
MCADEAARRNNELAFAQGLAERDVIRGQQTSRHGSLP